MNKKHEKSSCCKGRIVRHGAKRRRCDICGKTWTVWKKKRGRRSVRASSSVVQKYLTRERASSARVSRKRNISESCAQDRVLRSRDAFIRETPWREIPAGELILVADAVVELIAGTWVTAYFMLVRSVASDTAVILPPYVTSGRETPNGWKEAFIIVDSTILCRVRALVCDGHSGLTSQALWRKWILQRCQFHLIASVRARRGSSPMARKSTEGQTLMRHIRVVLSSKDEACVTESLSVVEEIGWLSRSKMLKKVVSGFVHNYQDYRTYINHTELNLPTTSNSAESVASMIGNTKQIVRGFKTARSFELWVVVTLKMQGTIKCRKNPQN